MAEKIHQHKAVLTAHPADIAAEGVYLAWRARDEPPPLAVYGAEAIDGVALDILAARRLHKLLHGRGHIMFGAGGPGIITHAAHLVALAYEHAPHLEAHAAAGALAAHCHIIAPCRVALDAPSLQREAVMRVGAHVKAQGAAVQRLSSAMCGS